MTADFLMASLNEGMLMSATLLVSINDCWWLHMLSLYPVYDSIPSHGKFNKILIGDFLHSRDKFNEILFMPFFSRDKL